MLGAKNNIAGYVRLSKEDGDKEVSDSIVNQKELIKNVVENMREEYNFVGFFEDDGYSGLNFERPGFKEMIKQVENGNVNMIITKDLSRLGRDYVKVGYYLDDYFVNNHIRYKSILDNIDTGTNNSNNDIVPFKAVLNDLYSKDISKKSRAGIKARRERGLAGGAKAPYGYKKSITEKGKFVVDREKAEVVKKIFNMYATGSKIKDIRDYLEKSKIHCPDYFDYGGAKNGDYAWSTTTISRMLENEVYIGHLVYGKKVKLSYKSKKVQQMPKELWKKVENCHEPIVCKELFDKVQEIHKRTTRTRHCKHEWLLNGITFCKECGSKMILSVDYEKGTDNIIRKSIECLEGHRKNCVMGYKGIRESVLNEIVLNTIKDKCIKLLESNKLEQIVKKEFENVSKNSYAEMMMTNLKQQIKEVETKINYIYDDYRSGIIRKDDFERMYLENVENKERIKKDIIKYEQELNSKTTITTEYIKSIINDFLNIESWNINNISSIIEKIEVDIEKNVNIYFKYNIFNMV